MHSPSDRFHYGVRNPASGPLRYRFMKRYAQYAHMQAEFDAPSPVSTRMGPTALTSTDAAYREMVALYSRRDG